MAFIVEDGTIVPDANAYISVEWADNYFAERGIADWTGTVAEKQGWIVRATDYIELRFSLSFLGRHAGGSLSFPRMNSWGVLIPTVPDSLKKATAEYALRAKDGRLYPEPDRISTGGPVARTFKKVGPIETETSYMTTSGKIEFHKFPGIDAMLKGLIFNHGKVIR